jgi:hypothetical protein
MGKKTANEKDLKTYVTSDPERQKQYGDPWSAISKAVGVQKEIYKELFYIDNFGGFRGEMADYARKIVRSAHEKQKPSNERIRGYQDSALPTLEQELFSTAPVYKGLEKVLLTESLTEMQDVLGTDNATVKLALDGKTPDQRAKEVVDGSKLDDVAVRKQLYEGGQQAVEASTDPMIVMMRTIEPAAVAVHMRNEDEVDSVLRKNAGTIAKVRFAQGGLSVPPDATFTLRLSYGAVKGYKQDGKQIPWFTTMGGAYEHAAAHGSKPPYELPASWIKAKSAIDPKTVYDTASTPDIIGGNSGSPVVNKNAEVVGIIFDGNIESLPWNFVYDDVQGRSIATDSRAIIESLRKIYHADALATELAGPADTGASKAMKPKTKQK